MDRLVYLVSIDFVFLHLFKISDYLFLKYNRRFKNKNKMLNKSQNECTLCEYGMQCIYHIYDWMVRMHLKLKYMEIVDGGRRGCPLFKNLMFVYEHPLIQSDKHTQTCIFFFGLSSILFLFIMGVVYC